MLCKRQPILGTRDLVNWKHYQLYYTPPFQRSAWRWP